MFQDWKQVRVGVITWNLAGKQPPSQMDVSEWFLPANEQVDILMVGIQEMVDLSVVGSLTEHRDRERANQWRQIFQAALDARLPQAKFRLVGRKLMYGLL